jgi:hypothetical protein
MRLFKHFEKITFVWCLGNSDGLEQANAKMEVLKTELKSITFSFRQLVNNISIYSFFAETTTDLAAFKLHSANATTSLASVDANFIGALS